MAFQSKDGKKFTNKPPMMAHNRSMERQQPEQQDPLAQPGEKETGAKPVMTQHHEDGTHTTVHEDGQEVHHENHEALHEHLKKHFPEHEEPDGDEGEEAEYE